MYLSKVQKGVGFQDLFRQVALFMQEDDVFNSHTSVINTGLATAHTRLLGDVTVDMLSLLYSGHSLF
jgi:hypothetical protein